MVFSSHIFLLVFLPCTLLGFFWIRHHFHESWPRRWLLLASLVFYGWWSWAYLGLLLANILGNYWIGRGITLYRGSRQATWLMWLGIATNLALLGYFKYANFFLANLNTLLGTDWALGAIVLPLALSFHTFQQIAYLVETRNGLDEEMSLERYLLFVAFFPQLIAGPIVRHTEIGPQIARLGSVEGRWALHIGVGLTIFIIGLAKKTLLADPLAPLAREAFDAAQAGPIPAALAWQGMLAYTLQLYFDFSGYSDMAVGLARMFGIHLPINFWSPYRAVSITEFWRRWHITLSRFLRDYLYIPLGGNRKGTPRTYLNLLLTMFLGGLWHGAAWTFVLWGTYHGLLLALHRALRRPGGAEAAAHAGRLGRLSATLATFLLVALGWVLFRAQDLPTALHMYASLVNFALPGASVAYLNWLHLAVLLAVVFLAPNTWQIMAGHHLVTGYRQIAAPTGPRWHPTPRWALLLAILGATAVLAAHRYTEFLYFQF